MTTAQLSQYLETAVDLEKAVFLQARRLAQYKEEIQALDRAARRPAPAPPEAAPVAPVPKPPMEPLREILGKTLLGFLLSLAAVTGISVLTLGPARGWMTGAIGGVLLGGILAIVAYLKAVRASSFRWRTYHLLMENYQLIHGTYGLRREKSQAELEARQKAYPDLLRRHQERVTQALQRKQALEAALPQLPAAGRQQGRSGRPLCPRRPVPQIPDLCPGLLPVRAGAVRPLRHLGRAPRCLPAAGGRAPGGVDPHRLEPNPPPGGPFADPAVPPLHCPAGGPRTLPVRPFPASQVGGFLSPKLPLYGGNTPAETDKIVAFP